MTAMTRRNTAQAAAALVLAAIVLTGCGKFSEPYRDAPVSDRRDDTPADVVNMPDGFSNVASKCDGPNRVYVAYSGGANRAAIAVVPNDPRCIDQP